MAAAAPEPFGKWISGLEYVRWIYGVYTYVTGAYRCTFWTMGFRVRAHLGDPDVGGAAGTC